MFNFGFSSRRPRAFGAAPISNVLVGTGSQSLSHAYWRLLHQPSGLRIRLEHSQSLDVCYELFGITDSGFNMSSQHSQSDHESIAGRHNAAGDFLSKDTACYPDSLANAFANLIDPLVSDHHEDLGWPFSNAILPTKGYDDFPKSSEDGGGLYSLPDWSQGNRQATDSLHNLRVKWRQMILDQRLDRQLLAYVAQGPSAEPPFSEEILQPFMNELNHFIRIHGLTPDWSIREHQPMRLGILAALSAIMEDKDTTLFVALQAGSALVSTMTFLRRNVFLLMIGRWIPRHSCQHTCAIGHRLKATWN